MKKLICVVMALALALGGIALAEENATATDVATATDTDTATATDTDTATATDTDAATDTDTATATDTDAVEEHVFSGETETIVFRRLKLEGPTESWPVYSAPSKDAWRGADGMANLSTNAQGGIWYAGWDGNWLLVAYPYSAGCWRVGYVSNVYVKDRVDRLQKLSMPRYYSGESAIVPADATVSDDYSFHGEKETLDDANVTVLCSLKLYGEPAYYIEGTVDGKTYRGFASELK